MSIARLRSALRRLVLRHAGGTAVILVYHRVATPQRDPQLLAVSPRNFDAHVRTVRRTNAVVSLAEVIQGLASRKLPDRAVAITFDDGYADNLHAATPILERHGVPATVFVCSGYLDHQEGFWWDEVERLVLGPGRFPPALELQTPSARFAATLSDSLTRNAQQSAEDRGWNVLAPDSDPRHTLYRDLCAFILPLAADDRAAILSQLRGAVDSPEAPRESDRPLSSEEIAQLAGHALVRFGGHTVNHARLAERTTQEQRAEIGEDKATLEGLCGRELPAFAYPYGELKDYTSETVSLVREVGYAGACSNHPGVVKPWTDPLRMPRHLVRDWDTDVFSAALDGWFNEPL